jgi:large subunit ribosomal protein L18
MSNCYDKRRIRRKKIIGNINMPRVIFSKTNRYLIVQAIDDLSNKTICYLNTKSISLENKIISYKNNNMANIMGEVFANSLLEKNIKKIYFDRNGYKYHGNIKTFCESMRKLGIDF